MERFYATYRTRPDVIAIFDREADRDNWVACQDWFSQQYTPDDTDRVAISYDCADALHGGFLADDEDDYIEDDFREGVYYAQLPADEADMGALREVLNSYI